MRYKKINLLIIFLLALGVMNISFAEGKGSNKSLRKATAGSGDYYKMNINNIDTYIYNNGIADVIGSSSGFIYPKGSNKAAIYQSGFLWGGKLEDKVFLGGATYTTDIIPGKIGEDPNDARIFRVRPDYGTGSMLSELNDDEGSESDIRAQYKSDWMDWPWQDGAPYLDADGNGKYDPDPDGNGKYNAGEDIPGIPGASQTIFYIGNTTNNDEARKFYGSFAVPIELHVTVWAYSTVGPLSNMIFKKYHFINKGTQDITDMYCSAWNDPDNGNAGDDFVGCDSTLGIGFCYNAFATDQVYGNNPPATAFDFFQGPVVIGEATDSAKFMGRKLAGYKNLDATAFYYFVNENNTIYSDPDLDVYATGTLYFYELLKGRIGATGEEFPIPEQLGGGTTHWPLSGDPVAGTGYLDGIIKPAADRRYGLASGPFTLAAGDTQEVVIAEMVAGGTAGIDNIGALKLLRTYDAKAQDAYDKDFQLPSPPAAPILKATGLDQEVILSWSDDLAAVNTTESYDNSGYKFEGYNVYQLPSASATKEDAVTIATYDIVDGVKAVIAEYTDPATGAVLTRVDQAGNDTGIKRFIDIKNDYINNRNLINGSKYFYAVTSYCYSDDPLNIPNNLENPLAIITVIPQSPNPGVIYNSEYGSSIEVTANGTSDGSCNVVVIDPSKVTGDDYKIEFYNNADGDPVWKMTDVTTGTLKADNISNQSGDDSYPVIDGLMAKVMGPELGIKQIEEEDQEGNILDKNVGPYSLGTTGYICTNRAGSLTPTAESDRTFDRFGYWGTDDVIIDFSQESLTWDYSTETVHIDAATGQPYKAPFAVYRRKFPSGELVRLFAGFWDTDESGTWNNNGVDWQDINYEEFCYEPIYCWQGYDANGNEINYDPANDAQYVVDNDLYTSAYTTWSDATGEFAYPFVTATLFGMYKEDATPPYGNKVVFITNKPNSSAVNFTFTAPTVDESAEAVKADVEKINVFPNPYYGANPQELNKYQRFVTFSHLPKKAIIRIFNLAGQLVQTINHETDSQFEKWNLLNQSALPVASGLYIAYIEMPDLGKTKILKLAIVQEQQILDRF